MRRSCWAKRYFLETDSHLIGRVYARRHRLAFLQRYRYDRVMIVQHEPLNVFVIDQLLQDCIRYIRSQTENRSGVTCWYRDAHAGGGNRILRRRCGQFSR